jgi:hypothetical protein
MLPLEHIGASIPKSLLRRVVEGALRRLLGKPGEHQ